MSLDFAGFFGAPPRFKNPAVQSVLLDRAKWTEASAKAWARRKGFRSSKVETTLNFRRLRQFAPGQCRRGTVRTDIWSNRRGAKVRAIICDRRR